MYVRLQYLDGVYVFSAQGEHLGLAESRALAFAAAVQNEMSPQSVH